MRRHSYQRGSVTLKPRADTPAVWAFRYKEGKRYRSVILGDIKALPTKSLAEAEADKIRQSLNIATAGRSITISQAIEIYKAEDMPPRQDTQRSLKSYLWLIENKWGKLAAATMARDIIAVEQWLNSLEKRKGGPFSKKSKQHMKATLHVLFESIIRRGGMDLQRNPMGLLRIKGRPAPTRKQLILTVEQYHKLMEILPPRVAMMAQLGMCLGLRASEILGLRWEDIDLANGSLVINRSVVGKHQDETKTLASNDDLPLHESLIAALEKWKADEPVIDGWLFGSPVTQRPFHRDSLLRWHLEPAGRKVGIYGLGWHSFRHTYRSMMRGLDLPMEVQKRLMRHSDIRTTLGYGGKEVDGLRGYNTAVVEMVRRKA
jgi:integrase